jgi:SAM-dependent methyltransferase
VVVRRSPPYSRYASVYDLIGQRIFGERMAEATLEWLDGRGVRPRNVADLACGTGAATLVFAATGAVAIGVDRSPEMLAVADKAAREAGLSVTWIEQDLRDLVLPASVDLATSFFDSVNYLVDDQDLPSVFARVHASLVEGGYFVFDLNTRRRFAEGWGSACLVASDRDDLFGVYRSWFEPESDLSPLHLTFFVRTDAANGDCWERFDEEHVERAYALDNVSRALVEAGFDVVDVRAFHDGGGTLGGPGSEADDRVVFFARRPVGAGSGDEQR